MFKREDEEVASFCFRLENLDLRHQWLLNAMALRHLFMLKQNGPWFKEEMIQKGCGESKEML
jgi:hypothetical protein